MSGAAPSTIARKVTSMKAFVVFLADAGVTDAEAASGIKTPPRAKSLPDTISQEEARWMLAVADKDARDLLVAGGFPNDFRASFRANFREEIQAENRAEIRLKIRDLALLELLYDCGLRSAEACSLRLTDVRRDQGMLIVHGKGEKTRMVPYLPVTLEVIDLWLTMRPRCDSEYLLLTANCNRLDTSDVRRIVRAAGKRAGLTVHAHQLRHACATHLMEKGVDTRVVQEFLGHSSIKTTQIYTHVSAIHMKDVYLHSHPRAEKEKA
jgi:site-specific recombinase XerD